MRSILFHSVRRIPFRSLSTPPPNFEDPGVVFQRKSTWEIVRALAVLRACSVNALVDNSLQLLRGMERVVGESGLRVLLKRTLYEQFVGGENPAELQGCMERVSCAGMRCMLAATMEEDVGEGGSERVYRENCRRILEVVDMSSKGCPSPMIQLKLSGLLPARLLVLVGDCYMEAESKLQVAEAIGEGMAGKSVQMKPFEGRLNGEDQDSLRKAVGRFKDICESARQKGVRILVDAECTYLNEGLSALTLGAVAAFNSHAPVVWNTYQCYLKAADHRVRSEMGLIVKQLGAHFGAKMVRGAYMLQERQRALQLGLPSPVCDDYSATCINYDKIVSFLLDKTGELGPRCQFIAATHNEHSIHLVIQKMEAKNLDRRYVCFGQLYGMCDQISNSLAEHGFAVYKSVPYGTLSEVLPYLARRAVENKSVLAGARKEQDLLLRELRSRLLPRPLRSTAPETR